MLPLPLDPVPLEPVLLPVPVPLPEPEAPVPVEPVLEPLPVLLLPVLPVPVLLLPVLLPDIPLLLPVEFMSEFVPLFLLCLCFLCLPDWVSVPCVSVDDEVEEPLPLPCEADDCPDDD